MAKSSKGSYPKSFSTPHAPKKCVDRNLAKINPLKEQFEPTAACPVNSHKRMAGAA